VWHPASGRQTRTKEAAVSMTIEQLILGFCFTLAVYWVIYVCDKAYKKWRYPPFHDPPKSEGRVIMADKIQLQPDQDVALKLTPDERELLLEYVIFDDEVIRVLLAGGHEIQFSHGDLGVVTK
jgi:hypothetical protein